MRIISGTNQTVKTYDYDAFGNDRNELTADANPFRYCGEYFDTATETYFLRARWYDPATGRFTQQDSWAYYDPNDPLSLNLYLYCYGNPVMYVDPSGHAEELARIWVESMWWLTLADGLFPYGDIVYGAGIIVSGVVDTVNYIGIDAIARFVVDSPDFFARVFESFASNPDVTSRSLSEVLKKELGGGGSLTPGGPDWGKGFETFRKLKRYLGSAGEGNEWHHIVEQCQIEKSGFDPTTIHNTENIVSIPKELHRQITGYYNSIDPWVCDSMRVRDWLAGQDFAKQYRFGIETLQRFAEGVK